MKLVLIGIQGAGKSTQGNMLSEQLKVPYLSTGHIFRIIAKEKTPVARYVKETMNAGHLIPDEKTIPIVEEYLSRKTYKKGYILDGFPRTLTQAKQFKNGIDHVIHIDLPEKEALWRIALRGDTERNDETLLAIKKRINLFMKETKPVIEFYRKKGQLIEVDGTKSVREVNQQILKSLGKQLVKNRLEEWKQKKRIILAITGLAGSGKTEAAEYFAQKGLPLIHFGNIVNEYIDKHGLKHEESVHKKIRMDFRKEHGMEAMAILSKEKIRKALEKTPVVIIDGLRSFEEYLYLKKEFNDASVTILTIWTDKKDRFDRLTKRRYRGTLKGKDRDINEVLETNKGPTIALADFLVMNDLDIEDFHSKLEQVYREVYFS